MIIILIVIAVVTAIAVFTAEVKVALSNRPSRAWKAAKAEDAAKAAYDAAEAAEDEARAAHRVCPWDEGALAELAAAEEARGEAYYAWEKAKAKADAEEARKR